MAPELLAGLIMGLLFLMLLIGMHVGLAMVLAGTLGIALIIPTSAALSLLGQTVNETLLSFELSIIPLFVLMGYFTSASGLSRDLYSAFNAWLGHMRGGLAMATISACGAFGAISGSSVATAATMTEVALPEMRRFGYASSLATGVIAAGGTIGILIPPSVIMVLYGVMTQTSIVDLFIAGLIPGLLMVLLFLVAVMILATLKPEQAPRGNKMPLRDRFRASRSVFGTGVLFILVIGGLYMGIFTPTEAGGIGAFGAWFIALVMGRMSWAGFFRALIDTVRTTVMIFTILIGALVLKNFMVFANIPGLVSDLLQSLELSALGTMLVIIAIYIVLGALLDTMAMILLTIPVFFPIVTGLGYDPVWFGILLVVLVEMALITPPMGMNVFIIKGMTPETSLAEIFRGVLPFVLAQALLVVLLMVFPEIALFMTRSAG